jgi:hypothetical protein
MKRLWGIGGVLAVVAAVVAFRAWQKNHDSEAIVARNEQLLGPAEKERSATEKARRQAGEAAAADVDCPSYVTLAPAGEYDSGPLRFRANGILPGALYRLIFDRLEKLPGGDRCVYTDSVPWFSRTLSVTARVPNGFECLRANEGTGFTCNRGTFKLAIRCPESVSSGSPKEVTYGSADRGVRKQLPPSLVASEGHHDHPRTGAWVAKSDLVCVYSVGQIGEMTLTKARR